MVNNNIIILEYIWLDSKNDFRSKTKVMTMNEPILVENLPLWNYDGSSTGQAEGTDSEIFLKPTVIFLDPFRKQSIHSYSTTKPSLTTQSYLVWCDMFDKNKTLLKNSNRPATYNIFEKYKDEIPWFGLEQEYFIINPKTNLPLGFDVNSNPEPQGKYYCSVGSDKALCRQISEEHLNYCLYAGIKIGGVNAEVAPAQWEYQIGPCVGIDAGDHLWISRYILNRIAETHGYNISYHPKPLGTDTNWNGSGCHTNFSTKLMREVNGIEHINESIKKLEKFHITHMKFYGTDNKMRMSGVHETSSFDKFTVGRANRGASVRIPNMVLEDSCGYFEDRRPSANCDPYLVTGLIMNTNMINLKDINEKEFTDILTKISNLSYII